MKKVLPNIIFMILGIISIVLELKLMFNGVLGWFLVSAGLIFIITGVLIRNNPFKLIIRCFTDFI